MHEIRAGIYHVNGVPQVMVSADYPYYRDDPAHWEQRLRQLRDVCLVTIVTFYIPWRHHQPVWNGAYDFRGVTRPNRNVIAFIEMIEQLGMHAVAKPGPFIHAETNFGSLPNEVSPTLNPAIEAWQNSAGEPNTWASAVVDDEGFISGAQLALPAPFDPIFLAHTQAWLSAVSQQVILPHVHKGTIILVQIANEGIYSDGQAPVWDYDYSPSSVARYRDWLPTQYTTLEGYNAAHGTEYDTWQQIDPPRLHTEGDASRLNADYADWGSYAAHFLGEVYQVWLAALALPPSLPIVINLNPPRKEAYGTDAWLARVEPERYPQVHYGFTNWIGDVSADASAFDRYLLTAKRMQGINFEENWGFSKLYDASYIEPATSFYQTLLAFAGGATGYNIYTGVNTDAWDDHLDALHERPYPDASPILEDGSASYKAVVAGMLNRFLHAHGSDFLTFQPWRHIAFGVVQAQCYSSMWADFPSYGYAVNAFQRLMHENGFDYGIVSLDHATPEQLRAVPMIVLAHGDDLSVSIRERLAAYARHGGRVFIVGDTPHPFAMNIASFRDVLPALARLPRVTMLEGSASLWVRQHPHSDEAFIIALTPQGEYTRTVAQITLENITHTLTLQSALGGGAILRVHGDRIVAGVCKGINDWLHSRVTPLLHWDDHSLTLDHAGDLEIREQ